MMPWPLSQDYNEAIQSPAQCFADPDLQRGEAVTNELGLPMPCSGNFADVYAVQAGQQKWAVKCFTRQIQGLRERYAEISKYLQQVKLPFMVDFKFLEQGIRVRGQWYPILKMQWVEGQALNAFVKSQVDNPAILRTTSQLWAKMGNVLREANLAHGDLQHGNVLLVPGAKAGTVGLKLVDYDGMCVPALEFLKATEVGHPAYQHPQRLREASYGLHIDNFSHLVIYTALRALTVGGKKLWDRFDNGDNLLFSQKDFENPSASPVFKELLAQSDGEVRKLTGVLAEAARLPVKQVPQLEDVLPNDARPKTAIPKPTTPKAAEPNPFVPPHTPARARKKKDGKGVLAAVLIGCSVMAGVAVGAIILSSAPSPTSSIARIETKQLGTPHSTKSIGTGTTAARGTIILSISLQGPMSDSPPLAQVYLDGEQVTPFSLKELSLDASPGVHEVKVVKDGFRPFVAQVHIVAGKTENLSVRLEPIVNPIVELQNEFVTAKSPSQFNDCADKALRLLNQALDEKRIGDAAGAAMIGSNAAKRANNGDLAGRIGSRLGSIATSTSNHRVVANQFWQKGPTVSGGDVVVITARGTWHTWPRGGPTWQSGPDGTPYGAPAGFPLPGVPQGALVAKVGNRVILIGSNYIANDIAGTLEFANNDDNRRNDNQGMVSVTVEIIRKP